MVPYAPNGMDFITNQISSSCLTLQQYEVIVKGTRFFWRTPVGKRHTPDTVSSLNLPFFNSFPDTGA